MPIRRQDTRRRSLRALVAALAATLMPLPPASAQPDPAAQSAPLPRIELQAGVHLIRAEVAQDFASRARGLMFRDALAPNHGMLFVFEQAARQCFWMRNTRIPLSAAFLDDSGRIVNIADMQPFSDDSHCSAAPVRFVLEMEQGWFVRRGLREGSRLAGPRGLFSTP
jgi:uncharacterized membrane protein (UPF0127 family)